MEKGVNAMSQYEKNKLFQEFAVRTKRNLQIIESQALKNSDSAFEFTQLVNSLYGLLILPQQRYYKEIMRIDQSKFIVSTKICNIVSSWYPDDERDAHCLFRHLRNSLSHPRRKTHYSASLEFSPKDDSPTSIIFIDKPTQKQITEGKYPTGTEFKLEVHHNDLKEMIFEFCDILSDYYSVLE